MARLNLVDTIYPQGVAEAPLEYDQRPDWIERTWEDTGLIQYNDLNNDGRIQMYNDSGLGAAELALTNAQTEGDVGAATTAVATAQAVHDAELDGRFADAGWAGNELDVNNDILVLANPEIAQLPPGLSVLSPLVVWQQHCQQQQDYCLLSHLLLVMI